MTGWNCLWGAIFIILLLCFHGTILQFSDFFIINSHRNRNACTERIPLNYLCILFCTYSRLPNTFLIYKLFPLLCHLFGITFYHYIIFLHWFIFSYVVYFIVCIPKKCLEASKLGKTKFPLTENIFWISKFPLTENIIWIWGFDTLQYWLQLLCNV